MIDASSFSTPSLRLEYAEDAVAFLAIDADETGPLSSHILHPSILCGSANHLPRQSRSHQPFMSPDPLCPYLTQVRCRKNFSGGGNRGGRCHRF